MAGFSKATSMLGEGLERVAATPTAPTARSARRKKNFFSPPPERSGERDPKELLDRFLRSVLLDAMREG
jgi:hypothetical protein